ncbi:MAG: 1-acyl-sn-glycerol-3-phosphate acyltransferase [Actinobacteria bacterium]|nr:1-acyl-sn-glycerol-3-phosphate acyltransferase [Actinomycetota bacterium]MCG2797164.1 1-acyl-sn-glycerol-3-phosphate acyltransferase [Cellulomonas sp.]
MPQAETVSATPPAPSADLDPIDALPARALRRFAGAVIAAGVHACARLDASQLPDGLVADGLGRRPLLVTNHRSPLDYCVVVTVCRTGGRWPAMFAREDFFARAPSRLLLRALALIPAATGRGAPDGLRRANRLLDQGRVVAIAAEGRLVHAAERPDGVGRLRAGTGRLAAEGADVTVLTITGADAAWPPGRSAPRARWRHRPTITVRAERMSFEAAVSPTDAGAAVRTTMVELVGRDPA